MKKYHLDKVYTDYDELLQSDVDAIYCALPNHLHYEFSKKALENGKNVIIEKPITANSKELEDLIETANKKNLMIFEAMNLHYTPAFLSLKEDLKKLGDIKLFHLTIRNIHQDIMLLKKEQFYQPLTFIKLVVL